jgi:nitrite reductase/ring-hydroxylating ferredoxin subunit
MATEANAPLESPPARRTFLQLLLGAGLLGSLASFFYPVLQYLIPPAAADLGSDEVVAGKVGELKLNAGKIFRFGSRPGLIVRNAQGEYNALSATCTHLDCIVQYRSDMHRRRARTWTASCSTAATCSASGAHATTASTT